jgi:hypothetical protein
VKVLPPDLRAQPDPGGDLRPHLSARRLRLYLVVMVASAIFLKLCSGTLEELRARFAKHNGIAEYELVYDYVVE